MYDEDEQPHGAGYGPLIAVLGGILVLVAAMIAVPKLLPAQPYTTLLAGGAVAGLVLWGIGFVATIRQAGAVWMLGSLLALLGAGVLAGHLIARQHNASGREDPSSFTEIAFGANGSVSLPADAMARGPISKMFGENLAADAADKRALNDAMGKTGAGNLNSPYTLAQNPQSTANCGAFDAVRTQAREQGAKRAERLAAITKAIDSAQLDAAMKDALHEITGKPGADPVLENDLAGIDATADLCVLLARKSWFNNNYVFGFNNGGDMARYKALQAKRAESAGTSEKLDKAAAERMKAGQEKVRALLS